MSAQSLSSRAIIGSFYKALAVNDGASWVNLITMLVTSDQESETYNWLGQVPAMREWIGGRQAKGFRDNGISITNRHYEGTIEVLVEEMRRDKTGQVLIRVNELARRSVTHWASLLSQLIVDGESAVCYDGQFFFDTDHSEGDSGSQSNDISVDISTLPVVVAGSTTAPSVEEFQFAITKAIQSILGIVDDQGEPMNEDATDFLVMVPLAFWHVAQTAVRNGNLGVGVASQSNLEVLQGINISIAANVRLDTLGSWTTKFAVFRTGGNAKSLIRQQETPIQLSAIAEGSELEFKEQKHQYGIDTWRNVGYGFWQDSCLVTLT